MDASQYKDYILVLLFVKYVSDKYAGDPQSLKDGWRSNRFKEKEVRLAILKHLQDEKQADIIFEIVRNQNEY